MADVALNLWTLIDMMGRISVADLTSEYLQEQRVINDLLNPHRVKGEPTGYNVDAPGSLPIVVTPLLVIDHIESLNDREQLMILHGGIIFMWNDPRLKWNISEYGDVREISRTRTSLRAVDREPYIPKIHITELFARTADILRFDSTQVSISWQGDVTVRTKVQVKTTCYFEFDDYPHDRQNCSFSLYSPLTIDRFEFSPYGALHKSPRVNSFSGVPSILDVADFTLVEIEMKRVHLLPRSIAIDNPEGYPKKIVRTVFWFNTIFERNNKYYFVRMTLPLFCITTSTLLVAMIQSYHGMMLLLLMTSVQFMNGVYLVETLPPDYGSMPLIGFLATLVFLQTTVLILWRGVSLSVHQNTCDADLMKRMDVAECCIRVIVLISLGFYATKLLEIV